VFNAHINQPGKTMDLSNIRFSNPLNDRPDPNAVIQLLAGKPSEDAGFTATVRQPRMSSFNARVSELVVGECAAKMRTVDNTISVDRLPSELPMIREQVRNATTPAVTRAKQINKGATYSIEVGDFLSPSGRLFVIAVVTRES
jgi:hypothetical protein